MFIPIIIVGIALFTLAFTGIGRCLPTIFGLAAIIGLIYGCYFLWLGVSGSSENYFGWGCVLLVGSGAFLIVLKTTFGD